MLSGTHTSTETMCREKVVEAYHEDIENSLIFRCWCDTTGATGIYDSSSDSSDNVFVIQL